MNMKWKECNTLLKHIKLSWPPIYNWRNAARAGVNIHIHRLVEPIPIRIINRWLNLKQYCGDKKHIPYFLQMRRLFRSSCSFCLTNGRLHTYLSWGVVKSMKLEWRGSINTYLTSLSPWFYTGSLHLKILQRLFWSVGYLVDKNNNQTLIESVFQKTIDLTVSFHFRLYS